MGYRETARKLMTTLCLWLVYIFLQGRVAEEYTRCDNAYFTDFPAAIIRTNSKQFDLSREKNYVEETKIFIKIFHTKCITNATFPRVVS